jgi:hypothetical protein
VKGREQRKGWYQREGILERYLRFQSQTNLGGGIEEGSCIRILEKVEKKTVKDGIGGEVRER